MAALPYQRSLLALCALATLAFLGWLLHYARYGIDFTDEGFYLNWISTPFSYPWSLSQFGFIYNPLYVLADGNIARLRQANILIVFLLAWLLFAFVMNGGKAAAFRDRLAQVLLSAGFSVAALAIFSSWLVTPNYNTLAFQALLVASSGVTLFSQGGARRDWVGAILVGTGGWLAFMAKPSTAVVLSICVLLYLAVSRRLRAGPLSVAVGTALVLLCLSGLVIDGSIAGFAHRIQTAITLGSLLGGGHTLGGILRLDDYHLVAREKFAIAGVSLLTLLAAGAAASGAQRLKYVPLGISLMFLASTLAAVSNTMPGPTGFGMFQGLVMWALVLTCVALVVMAYATDRFAITTPNWQLALFFMAMPYAYAFGTNNNYWMTQGFACAFWLLAGLVLLIPVSQRQGGWGYTIPIVFAAQALSAALLLAGINRPYRQPQALYLNTTEFSVNREGPALVLSEGYARYLRDALSAAKGAGLTPATPVIDLTGQSPGLLHVLQVSSLGQPWMIGGYPGSPRLAETALAEVPCDMLSKAWLLLEPSGPRRLPSEVIASYGARLDTHFTLVATWQTAPGVGGYAAVREQQLFKPMAADAVDTQCRAMGRRSTPY
jgi:hypothetical protein